MNHLAEKLIHDAIPEQVASALKVMEIRQN